MKIVSGLKQQKSLVTPDREAASNYDEFRAAKRVDAKKRLLEAAVLVIADRGIENLTLAEVGERAGFSRGLPAHYFGRKSDLLAAVARHVQAAFASRVVENAKVEPGLDALLHWVSSYFRRGEQTPNETRALQIVLMESIVEPTLQIATRAVTRTALNRLKGMLSEGIERGNVRPDVDINSQAFIILGTVRASMALWIADPDGIDLERMRRTYVAALKRNLGVRQ